MIARYRSVLIGAGLVAAALMLWFGPLPHGASPVMMRAAALVVLSIGCWATMIVPEHLAALGFFLGAMVLHVGEAPVVFRSEEHTSELQSLMRISYAVFCLKKKIK